MPIIYQNTDSCQEEPKVLYYAQRISLSGGQPVFMKLLPDGEPTKLSPKPSQRLYNHSPDGFQWSYSGSGPAQLALALLLHATKSPNTALAYYQYFKFEFVAAWGESWSITRSEILEWLKGKQNLELQRRLSTN